VLGDVGQPDLVGGLGAKLEVDEVVVDRRSGLSVQSPLLGEDRPDTFLRAQSSHPVLPGDDPACGKLVSNEAVPENRIVGVDGQRGVDQMCVVPIMLCRKSFAPLAERLVENPSTRQVTVTGTPSAARSRTSGYVILG
jgi:hypothetical protein